MMHLTQIFFCRGPLLWLAGILFNVLFVTTLLPAHATSHINGVDLREEKGTLNLFIHTDSPLRHEAKKQGHTLVLDLYDTALTSNTFAIQYEKAPSIQSVRVRHLDNLHLQLMIEGKGLTLPVVGFRELNQARSSNTFKQATLVKNPSTLLRSSRKEPSLTTSAGEVFLAIDSSEIKKTPPPVQASSRVSSPSKNPPRQSTLATDDLSVDLNSNTPAPHLPQVSPLLENDPSLAHMPIAIESDALDELESEEADASEEASIRQTLQTLFVLLAQWAKAHSNLLLGCLALSVTGFFLLTKLKRAHVAQASYALDSNRRFVLPEAPQNVGPASTDSSHNPYATRLHSPQKPLNQHTLQRVREKMKHTGFVSPPSAPQQPDMITEEGVNLRVKEAIARKQAQRYGKTAPTQPPVGIENIPTPLKNTSVTGNAFLHAMAQHMDTEGKENIAKAIQQSKPRY